VGEGKQWKVKQALNKHVKSLVLLAKIIIKSCKIFTFTICSQIMARKKLSPLTAERAILMTLFTLQALSSKHKKAIHTHIVSKQQQHCSAREERTTFNPKLSIA
jgi:predicted transposase YbfD/YdcC